MLQTHSTPPINLVQASVLLQYRTIEPLSSSWCVSTHNVTYPDCTLQIHLHLAGGQVTEKWIFLADNSFSITGPLHSIRPTVLSYLGCLLEAVFGLHLQMK